MLQAACRAPRGAWQGELPVRIYLHALALALAGGGAVWLAEPGHAHAAATRVEAVAMEGAEAIAEDIDPATPGIQRARSGARPQ
jgi:hypothetical protein